MNWIPLDSESQLEQIKAASADQPVVIFKHSTRCSISAVVKSRLERTAAPQDITFYYLDLLRHRHLSNRIAEDYAVTHESPQVLLIRNGECIYDESHTGISMEELLERAGLN
jgi:bacillithiol system protein YtxJ